MRRRRVFSRFSRFLNHCHYWTYPPPPAVLASLLQVNTQPCGEKSFPRPCSFRRWKRTFWSGSPPPESSGSLRDSGARPIMPPESIFSLVGEGPSNRLALQRKPFGGRKALAMTETELKLHRGACQYGAQAASRKSGRKTPAGDRNPDHVVEKCEAKVLLDVANRWRGSVSAPARFPVGHPFRRRDSRRFFNRNIRCLCPMAIPTSAAASGGARR